jgi:hypothetical protein
VGPGCWHERQDVGDVQRGVMHDVEAVAGDDGEVELLNDKVGEVKDEADEQGPRGGRVPRSEERARGRGEGVGMETAGVRLSSTPRQRRGWRKRRMTETFG